MVDSQTAGFLEVLAVGCLVGFILFIAFSILRPRVPYLYDFRRCLSRYHHTVDWNGRRVGVVRPRPNRDLFSWWSRTIRVTEEEIVDNVGYDAATFLRFVKMQLNAMVVLSGLLWVLMAVYGTGNNKNLPGPDPIRGLKVVSLSNVESQGSRLWATLIFDFVVVGVFLWYLFVDYSGYAELRRKYRAEKNPANYAVLVRDIPEEKNMEKDTLEFFERICPGQITEVIRVRNAEELMKARKKFDKAVASREKCEWVKENKLQGESPTHRPGTCGFLKLWKKKVDSLEYWESEQSKWQSEIDSGKENVKETRAAFILLTDKKAASTLAQNNCASNAHEWIISRAPEPADVHWKSFTIPLWQGIWRKAGVLVFVLLLTFFWSIPVTFIIGLVNIDNLVQLSAFAWLKPVTEASPAVTGFIAGLIPVLLLSLFTSLIPKIIRLAVSQERLHSLHHIDAKTRTYFYVFNIFGQFFFVVIAGSIINKLQEIIDNPSSLVNLLATSIPGNGVFFSTYIILNALISLPKALLHPERLIEMWIRLKRAKTERQRRAAQAKHSEFPYFKRYGLVMLVSLLGIVYSTLSPVVTYCATLFYIIAYPVFKYELLYATYREWDAGGYDYKGAYWGIAAALVLKQITAIGVFGIFKAPAQASLAAIPLGIAVLGSVFIPLRYVRVCKHGNLVDVLDDEGVPDSYVGLYEHPGLKPIGDMKNLNGLLPVTDVFDDDDSDDNANGGHVDPLKEGYESTKLTEKV